MVEMEAREEFLDRFIDYVDCFGGSLVLLIDWVGVGTWHNRQPGMLLIAMPLV